MNTEPRQPIQMLGALRPVNVWNPDDAVGPLARDLCGDILTIDDLRLSSVSGLDEGADEHWVEGHYKEGILKL